MIIKDKNKSSLRRVLLCCAAIILGLHLPILAQKGRTEIDLSQNNWKIVLDENAKWIGDSLFIPGTPLQNIPSNSPTGGWPILDAKNGVITQLPATIEQFHWAKNGNYFGVSGNYLGVSWFTTTIKIPETLKGKYLSLHFESTRLRAEVYLNGKLVGYDLISGTPFDVDITKEVYWQRDNQLAVRITDPNGNFDWRDSQNFLWGDYRMQPSHGFGGITGKVTLRATDQISVEDIFVMNRPEPGKVELQIALRNQGQDKVSGKMDILITDLRSGHVIWKKNLPAQLPGGLSTRKVSVSIPNAKLWSPESPERYRVEVNLHGAGMEDKLEKKFGFRWFEIRDVKGDKQFYLNGKRIVLRTAISWGFWPVNGISPSDKLARKQVLAAKALGLNMLNFHRGIGQQNVLEAADELGLLYFEEPGGNQFPESFYQPGNPRDKKVADFYFAARDKKFFRMIKRDRSHPSLIIYNMHNERGAQPQLKDSIQMLKGHQMDPSRIITYNSSNGSIKVNAPDPRFKLHLKPFDSTFYDYGWFDQHHAGGPGTYHNNLYQGKNRYAKFTDHRDEIYYLGEDGAIGTPPRLQLIRNEILAGGKDLGWEGEAYLKWYDAYDRFLRERGFSKAFANVDSLTRNMGNVAYYYQGRMIENIRINNIIDGYAVNGWESMKLENHSGIVDNYRNFKGDQSLIARYNSPLMLAVKIDKKVLSLGDSAKVDLYIINEKNIKGPGVIVLTASAPDGKLLWQKKIKVRVSGGSMYGEYLAGGFKLAAVNEGYTRINAKLLVGGKKIAQGNDEVFATGLGKNRLIESVMVADSSNVLQGFLSAKGIVNNNYRSGKPIGKVLVVNAFNPQQTGNPLVTDVLEWVNNGNTLIIIGNAEKWAEHLGKKEVMDYRGSKELGTSWYGGNYFSRKHEIFEGLPSDCVFNWEYQCFATYNKKRMGLRIENGEVLIACVSDHKPEVFSALNILPHGRGRILISSLDFASCINEVKEVKKAEGDGENAAMKTFDPSEKNSANVVGQRLLLNLIRFGVSQAENAQ